MNLQNFLVLFGGLGLFLFGMNLMGDGLELAAGSKLKILIEKLTKNKYMGALVGLIVTAIIQSSSATTVMVVGFVNAGLMNLAQAVGVIMGANIGTTVTGIMIAINLTSIAPIAIFIGVVMMSFLKKDSQKFLGQIIAGFGILFLGMDLMSTSMEPLAQSNVFTDLITNFSNPFIGLLAGLIFTAIIQSSSASVGVLQALGMAGAITLPNSIFVIYGQNIGTCVTALLASVGTTKTAKRTAIVHLLFNVFGTVMFVLVTLLLPFTEFIEHLAPYNVMAQISLVHVFFNIISTLILLPLSNMLIKISYKIIRGEDEPKEAKRLKYLDDRILNTPPIAVAQVIKEVERMGKLSRKNFRYSMEILFKWDKKRAEKIKDVEGVINFLNRNITSYIVKINGLDISDKDSKVIGSLFHVISDFERISDLSENICELAKTMKNSKEKFSSMALKEMNKMYKMVESLLDEAIYMLNSRNIADTSLVKVINNTEDAIDELTEDLKNNHIDRLNKGICQVIPGTVFMDLLNHLERIADHAINIAFSIF